MWSLNVRNEREAKKQTHTHTHTHTKISFIAFIAGISIKLTRAAVGQPDEQAAGKANNCASEEVNLVVVVGRFDVWCCVLPCRGETLD